LAPQTKSPSGERRRRENESAEGSDSGEIWGGVSILESATASPEQGRMAQKKLGLILGTGRKKVKDKGSLFV